MKQLAGDRDLRQLRQGAQRQRGVIVHAPVHITQAGKAGLVDPDRLDLRNQGVQRDVHAQHADQRARVVDGYKIGAGPHLAQEVRRIGTDPGGAAALDRRVVPGRVFDIVRIKGARVQRLLGDKARLSDAGIEEAVLRLADLRADAVVIGVDAVRVAGDVLEDLLDQGAVLRQVGVEPGGLLRRPFRLPCLAAHGAALHQHDAVQRVDRLVGRHTDGLLDAHEILVERVLRVLPDQLHHLHRLAVGFRLDGGVAQAEDRQQDREDHADGNRCNFETDRMHLDCSPIEWRSADGHLAVLVLDRAVPRGTDPVKPR